MFENLLTSSENRRLNLAELLTYHNNWITLAELAKKLNSSIRVLKDDIAIFRKDISEFTIKSSNKGIRIQFEKNKGLKTIFQKVLASSKTYQLLEIIFIYDSLSVNELAKKIFVSNSTLYRMIDQINQTFVGHNFKIETNPCRIVGDENCIRFYFYQYYYEKYSRLEWPFETVNEHALDRLLKFFIKFTQISVDFGYYNVFKTVATINLIRYKNGYLINTDENTINFDEVIANLDAFTLEFIFFEEATGMKVNHNLIYQVFTQYIQEGFSLNYERLIEKSTKNEKIADEINFLNQFLTEISEENQIELFNRNDLILAIHNSSHLEYAEPRSGYILYNQNKLFTNDIQNSFPKLYTQLYNGILEYRNLMGKPLTEDGIYFLIYILFTHWEKLVPQMRKKYPEIKVLIISDRHMSHSKMLKDFLIREFSDQLLIDIYTDIELNVALLEKLDYHFIVTNFPLPDLSTKKSIYIQNVPTHHDIENIQDILNEIIDARLIN